MDDIEHELFKVGRKLEQVAQSLRIREAEITIRNADLASDLGELIPRLNQAAEDLIALASRWHSTY
jgi:hypothetical protein